MVVTLPALGIVVTRANDASHRSPAALTENVSAKTSAAAYAERAAIAAKALKTPKDSNKTDAAKHKDTLKAIAKRTDRARALAEKPPAVTADGDVFIPGARKKPVRPGVKIATSSSQNPVPKAARSTVAQSRTVPKEVKASDAYKTRQVDGRDPAPTMANLLSSVIAQAGSSAAGGSISGTLSDQSSGLPVEGACVTAYSEDGIHGEPPVACSDGTGGYTIGGLAAGSYYLAVDDHVTGHIGTYSEEPISVGVDQAVNGVNFALEQGGYISGTVTDSNGDPLEGICAFVADPNDRGGYDGGCTDSAGHYRSVGLPAGSWRVSFSDEVGQHLSEWFDSVSSYDAATPVVTAVGQETTGIDAALALGGSISGVVADAESGAGLNSICVDFTDEANDFYARRCTDETGHYTSPGLPTGTYKVYFWDASEQGYRDQYFDHADDADTATPVSVVLGENTSGIDAGLVLLGRIMGTVTVASSGLPVAGTCVEASSDDGFGYATTDADGTYEMSGLSAGSYIVKFGCDNWVEQWYDDAATEDEATAVVVTDGSTATDIDGHLSAAGSISGTVTDADSGDPADGVCVTAYIDAGDEGFDQVGSAYSDVSGAYQIVGLETGDYRVKFSDCGSGHNYITRWYGDARDIESSTSVAVTFGSDTPGIDNAMVVGGSISGTVTEAGSGDPLSFICVGAYVPLDGEDFSEQVADAYTDEDGTYTLAGLETGTYRVHFQDCNEETHVAQWLGGTTVEDDSTSVTVEAGAGVTGVDIALPIAGSISGTVTDAETEQPLEDICVTVLDPADGHAVAGASPDETGQYAVNGLAPGSYVVQFQDCYESIYRDQYYDDVTALADATPVTVTEGVATQDVNAAMRSFGRITGVVTAEDGGAPLVGACVRAYAASDLDSTGIRATSCTDDDGRYTLAGLRDGQYAVRFLGAGTHVGEWYNDKATGQDADLIRVATGASVSDIDGVLAPGGSISGTVVKDGAPLAYGDTCAYLLDPSSFQYVGEGACTDENGHYTLQGVPTGTYKVSFQRFTAGFQSQWFDRQPDESTASAVSVEVGEAKDGIDADFTETGLTISGTVTRQIDGEPVSGFCIQVYTAAGSYVKQVCNYYVNTDGSYAIGGLVAGSYKLEIIPFQATNAGVREWYDGADTFDDATVVPVTDADVADIDFELRQGAVISGTVTDAVDGSPLGTICGTVSGPVYFRYICTDENGAYVTPDLPAGVYTLTMDDFYGPYLSESKPPVTVELGEQVTADFALTKGGTFSGTLSDDATNAALPSVCVSASNVVTGASSPERCSDADGHYSTAGLEAGTYKLHFTNANGRYVAEWYDNVGASQDAQALPVELGVDTPGIDASLQLGGIVTGTVRSAATGSPLAGICVKLYHASDGSFGGLGGCTGADGTYASAAVPPGQYKVAFSDASGAFVTQYYDGKATLEEADEVTVTAGGKVDSVDADMAGNSISGAVSDALTGEPLANVCVYVYNSGGAYSGNGTCTGSDGGYVLEGLPAGDYQVAFFDPAGTHVTQWYDGASSQAEAAVVSTPAALEHVDAAMVPVTTVAGTATDALTGEKLAGICAYIYKVDEGASSGAACTGEDGRIVFQDLEPGDYQLAFADTNGLHDTQWYGGSGDRVGSTVLHVTEGSILTGADAALVPITTVVGVATDAVTGDPLSGICAYLYPVGSSNAAAGSCTGSDGKVVFQGLDPGSYQLAYADTSAVRSTEWVGGSYLRSGADTIVLEQGQAKLDADVAMDKTGSITGTVSNSSGPVAGVCVYADDVNGDYTGVGGCTDSAGHYALPDLSPGSYTLGYYPVGMVSPTNIWYLNAASEATATKVVVEPGQTTAGIDQTVP